ncbi:hypothetical protein [Erythrobacter crassostreae]|uniref:Uncharacterized protein n=1 Tax=Erythrobacter crassostreae TaxID=2828328 RepID=A0A9X1F466_9SPHN|nr:hypothetical protein [Erythrobacter crassostrea]MBV7259951.1 hypothetical protein [Erythrobacter crassostrea]
MAYDPKAISTDDRSFALNMMWVGLAGSLLMLAGAVFGFLDAVDTLAGGFTAGTLIGLVFVGHHDEYFQRLFAFAARWACAAVGIWLFIAIGPITDEWISDPLIGLTAIAAIFHVAFAAARLRGY